MKIILLDLLLILGLLTAINLLVIVKIGMRIVKPHFDEWKRHEKIKDLLNESIYRHKINKEIKFFFGLDK